MEPQQVPNPNSHELAEDFSRGADEIAEFIFGARGSRRKVYYLAECSRLPVLRIGSVLCARRSVLLRWISRAGIPGTTASRVAARSEGELRSEPPAHGSNSRYTTCTPRV